MSRSGSEPWYREAFDEYYVDLYAHRDVEEAERFVRLLRGLVLLDSALVLDLACGGGRHMAALEREGARPVGLDLSPALLTEAAGVKSGHLVRGDMRALPFAAGVLDGVISMFTSFGYFHDLRDEMSVLSEVERCLKPKGWFVIDYMNAAPVKRDLEPESSRRVRDIDVFERRRIGFDGRRVMKEIELRRHGRLVRRYCESVRLLTRDEIKGMLLDAGLEPRIFYGDYSGQEYKEDSSPRMMALCRKMAASGSASNDGE